MRLKKIQKHQIIEQHLFEYKNLHLASLDYGIEKCHRSQGSHCAPVTSGVAAQNMVSLAQKRPALGILEPRRGWTRPQWKSKAPQGLVLTTS